MDAQIERVIAETARKLYPGLSDPAVAAESVLRELAQLVLEIAAEVIDDYEWVIAQLVRELASDGAAKGEAK